MSMSTGNCQSANKHQQTSLAHMTGGKHKYEYTRGKSINTESKEEQKESVTTDKMKRTMERERVGDKVYLKTSKIRGKCFRCY